MKRRKTIQGGVEGFHPVPQVGEDELLETQRENLNTPILKELITGLYQRVYPMFSESHGRVHLHVQHSFDYLRLRSEQPHARRFGECILGSNERIPFENKQLVTINGMLNRTPETEIYSVLKHAQVDIAPETSLLGIFWLQEFLKEGAREKYNIGYGQQILFPSVLVANDMGVWCVVAVTFLPARANDTTGTTRIKIDFVPLGEYIGDDLILTA